VLVSGMYSLVVSRKNREWILRLTHVHVFGENEMKVLQHVLLNYSKIVWTRFLRKMIHGSMKHFQRGMI
jgi:hypothetical protein